MRVKIIGSGSSGNCYLLTADSGERLIIELGVGWKQIQKELDFSYDKCAAIVSHRHVSDHAKSVKHATERGVFVYGGKDIQDHLLSEFEPFFVQVEEWPTFRFFGFTVKPFPLIHDVPINGFLIHHKECGVICFITDTCYAKTADGKDFDFPGVAHWMVEANFDEEILLNRVYNGNLDAYRADRVVKSHFSVQECEKMLRSQDLSVTDNLILIHLSDTNAHAQQFKERIERATGVPTCIAEAGLELNLNII